MGLPIRADTTVCEHLFSMIFVMVFNAKVCAYVSGHMQSRRILRQDDRKTFHVSRPQHLWTSHVEHVWKGRGENRCPIASFPRQELTPLAAKLT